MERLTLREIIEIIHRLRHGDSERRIASDLGVHRATVHDYHTLAHDKGYLDAAVALPSEAVLLETLGPPKLPPRTPSTAEPYRALIEEWAKSHDEIRSMHRRLCTDHGYKGSYSSVRRFVLANHPPEPPEVFARVVTGPGEEAQVDFGTLGKLKDTATGMLRTAHCFVMTLSSSRHQYVEYVFDQKVGTFVGCHIRAFASFGGVVRRVVVDNLKAAVLEHDLEDPVLCVPYKRLAQHYGFIISPCRPRTPRHKGKVESGIHYVKRNLWPGLEGMDIAEANRRAAEWVNEYAGQRVHGTTLHQPIEEFKATERPALAALPAHPFELCSAVEAKVGLYGHVNVESAHYSVPPELVGKRLEVLTFERVVQIYHGTDLVFTHPRATSAGEWVTHPGHIPAHKAQFLERTPEFCLSRAAEIGPSCRKLAETLAQSQPGDKRRALSRLIGLADKVSSSRVEAACVRALSVDDPTLRRVRSILAGGLDETPLETQQSVSGAQARPPYAYRFARMAGEFFGGVAERLKEVAAC